LARYPFRAAVNTFQNRFCVGILRRQHTQTTFRKNRDRKAFTGAGLDAKRDAQVTVAQAITLTNCLNHRAYLTRAMSKLRSMISSISSKVSSIFRSSLTS